MGPQSKYDKGLCDRFCVIVYRYQEPWKDYDQADALIAIIKNASCQQIRQSDHPDKSNNWTVSFFLYGP